MGAAPAALASVQFLKYAPPPDGFSGAARFSVVAARGAVVVRRGVGAGGRYTVGGRRGRSTSTSAPAANACAALEVGSTLVVGVGLVVALVVDSAVDQVGVVGTGGTSLPQPPSATRAGTRTSSNAGDFTPS